MKLLLILVALTVSWSTASCAADGSRSPRAALQEAAVRPEGIQEPLGSFVRRARHEFSNGAIARTTVFVGVVGLSLDGQMQQRFVGWVTQFEIEGQHRGDLASMRQIASTSTEAIDTQRSLPRSADDHGGPDSPNRIAHWLVQPLVPKTWGEVASPDDVVVTYAETAE